MAKVEKIAKILVLLGIAAFCTAVVVPILRSARAANIGTSRHLALRTVWNDLHNYAADHGDRLPSRADWVRYARAHEKALSCPDAQTHVTISPDVIGRNIYDLAESQFIAIELREPTEKSVDGGRSANRLLGIKSHGRVPAMENSTP